MSRQDTTASILTLDQIAAAQDRPEIVVDVPEWGGSVKIRGLTYDQIAVAREQAWDKIRKETNEDVLNAWCLALGLVAPGITFAVAKQWIMEKSFGPVNTILNEVLTASGLGRRA